MFALPPAGLSLACSLAGAFLHFPLGEFWRPLFPPFRRPQEAEDGYDSFGSAKAFISTFVGLCFLLRYNNFPVFSVNERVPCFGPFCLGKHREDVFRIGDALPIVILGAIAEIVSNCNSRPFY